MLNDLDLILMPVAYPEVPLGESVSLTDYIVVNTEDRCKLERLKRLRPSAAKELSDFWYTKGGTRTVWTDDHRPAFEFVGCRYDAEGKILPWRSDE